MKKALATLLIVLLSPMAAAPVAAAEVTFDGFIMTIPDEIVITGSEADGERKCVFTISVRSANGDTLPLRAKFWFELYDSLGANVELALAEVSYAGRTIETGKNSNNCNNATGQLVGPYKYRALYVGQTSEQWQERLGDIRVRWVAPAPVAPLTPAQEVALLKSQIKEAQALLKAAQAKLKKVCAKKPKPKGC